MEQPDKQPVAVVVVTWNSADVIEPCLRSAMSQSPSELVVVDNGSTDGTLEIVERTCPGATVVRHPINRGFAAGCNAGIAASRSPFVLLLNDDARLEDGYVETLLAVFERNQRVASVTGKLVYEVDGTRFIDSAGIELRPYALAPLDRGHGEIDRGQYDTAARIFGPSAAAAIYRREALTDVGPEIFDEDLFAYYEDVDLAWRLNRRGWIHVYEPAAVAYHRRRGPNGKPSGIAARAFANRYLVWLKNESAWRFALYGPLAIAWEAVRIGRRLLGEPGVLGGVAQAGRLVPRMLAKRSSRSAGLRVGR